MVSPVLSARAAGNNRLRGLMISSPVKFLEMSLHLLPTTVYHTATAAVGAHLGYGNLGRGADESHQRSAKSRKPSADRWKPNPTIRPAATNQERFTTEARRHGEKKKRGSRVQVLPASRGSVPLW